jgi:hypothetical protein
VEGLLVLVEGETLCLGRLNSTTQPLDFLLHLSMLAAFPDSLEVGLDLAFELEPVAPRAALKGFLDDIAAQLERSS